MAYAEDRRRFLQRAGFAMTGGALAAVSLPAFADEKDDGKKGEEEITPVEDLSQEHGLLNRVLLIYDESGRRLSANADFDVKHIKDAAENIRRFVEEYHEKQEEEFLFPRFQKANKLTDLVEVLKQQHEAGRQVTAQILQLTGIGAAKRGSAERQRLVERMSTFVRMYRPHEAREDTVLFPALRKIVSEHEYDSLGEEFEKREHTIFGGDGFEIMLDKVATIEKEMGIYDLRQFTPK